MLSIYESQSNIVLFRPLPLHLQTLSFLLIDDVVWGNARLFVFHRYAINDTAVDWTGAEAQIQQGSGGRSTVVSVKRGVEGGKTGGGQKRKAEAVVDAEKRDGSSKKSRRSLKKIKR